MPKKKDNNQVKQVKKSVQKKTAGAKNKIFENAPEEHYFILCNGQTAKNLRELADILESVDDGVFYHHVTNDRNDFALWIRDIFNDEDLANEIVNVKDKGNTRIIIYRYLLDCATRV